jgi:hypothetical protein
VRVQFALLRAFGVSAPRARSLIAEKPGQVADVLLRACHLRATDPTAVSKSWAGWIIHHVEHDTSFAGEVAFQEWRRTALARVDGTASGSAAGGTAGAGVALGAPSGAATGAGRARRAAVTATRIESEPAAPPVPRPAADPAADARWQRVLAVVRPQLSMLDYFGVEDAVPVRGDDDTLVLSASNDIAARALHRALPRLTEVLSEHEGRTVEIRVVLVPPSPSAA